MAINYAYPSHGSTAEYQCSGVPYVTGTHELVDTTVSRLSVPYVTRHFTVFNSGSGEVRVGFTENGVNSQPDANYFLVRADSESPRLEIKCQNVFVRKHQGTAPNVVTVVFALTNVTQDRFFSVTGSNGVDGVG